MNLAAVKGKELSVLLVSNSEYESLEGKLTESDLGEGYVHFDDGEDVECDIRESSIVMITELEYEDDDSEEEPEDDTEEPEEEEKEIKKSKYSHVSVNDIPPRKKKGLFGF